MSTLLIEDAPQTFVKKMGNKLHFKDIVGIYWDGMDWCQYDEVIPDKSDITALQSYAQEISTMDGKKFLSSLIAR